MNLKLLFVLCPLSLFGQTKFFTPDRSAVYDCKEGHLHSEVEFFDPGMWTFQNVYLSDIIVVGQGEVVVTLESDIVIRITSTQGSTKYQFFNTDKTYTKEYISRFKVKSINSYNRFVLFYLYE